MQQCARQPARAGANFNHEAAFDRAGKAGDFGGEIKIKDKVLAEIFFGAKPCAWITSRSAGKPSYPTARLIACGIRYVLRDAGH